MNEPVSESSSIHIPLHSISQIGLRVVDRWAKGYGIKIPDQCPRGYMQIK